MPVFANQSRSDLRGMYLEAWRKHRAGLPVEPLEAQIIDVIVEHPEYQALLNDADAALAKDFAPESGQSNPFLHMAMHLAVRDQIATDRPTGIRDAFAKLIRRRDKLSAEHAIAEHLADMIWQAQRSGSPPDEQVYLRRIQKLVR
jgi:hypothetical protein